jgi:hypothetical protein
MGEALNDLGALADHVRAEAWRLDRTCGFPRRKANRERPTIVSESTRGALPAEGTIATTPTRTREDRR